MHLKGKYPILFECLCAKFSLLPSSTRIVEQNHGQLRHSLKAKVGHDFTDSQQQYLTNIAYKYKETRSQSKRKRIAEKETLELTSKKKKNAQLYSQYQTLWWEAESNASAFGYLLELERMDDP